MLTATHFTGSLLPRASRRWFTRNWQADRQVYWTMVPTTTSSSGPQIEWEVQVERTSVNTVTYWIRVKNLTWSNVDFEGRYAILNV